MWDLGYPGESVPHWTVGEVLDPLFFGATRGRAANPGLQASPFSSFCSLKTEVGLSLAEQS